MKLQMRACNFSEVNRFPIQHTQYSAYGRGTKLWISTTPPHPTIMVMPLMHDRFP